MGLDMYLYKKIYVGNKYRKEEEKIKVILPEKDTAIFPIKSINNDRISEIVEEVAYWRKANHIHNWFVQNIQEGVDDCKEYCVTKEDLENLISSCKKVLEKVKFKKDLTTLYRKFEQGEIIDIKDEIDIVSNVEEIEELLPTQEGFFFGSTEYDKYYIQDIEDTIKMLEPLLEEEGDFYYSSSW